MLRLKLNHVSKREPWCLAIDRVFFLTLMGIPQIPFPVITHGIVSKPCLVYDFITQMLFYISSKLKHTRICHVYGIQVSNSTKDFAMFCDT